MITALTSGLTNEKYIPESEKNEPNPAEFTLKPLNGLEFMEVMNEMYRDENGVLRMPGEALKKAINFGVRGWKNFLDPQGEDVPFNKSNIPLIPAPVLSDLANKIISISEVGVAERKNSI